MARSRRGSFGLQPRVAPNVTGQIVALAREYVAKRDALIMDAWKNGGTFEGKKATDDMVLAYWKEREVGLDPTDPDFEAAKDQVMQLEYAVAQSKADVLHVQGKMSDNAYAQFFLKWAAKVPANSEFYRTLQKDAAQLIESAKAKSRANGEKAKTDAFNAFVKTTNAKDIAIGDAMTAAIMDLSKQTGLSITGNGDELLSLLTQNVKANPTQYRLLLDAIKSGDPHWDGQLTESYFGQHIQAATQGYALIADRAQKAGYVSAYASAVQGEASMSSFGQNLKVWTVAQTYSTAENAFLRVFNDPNASQMDKMSAANSFSAQLVGMAQTPGIDAASKTMIQADAARLLGQSGGDSPSFGASMLGRTGLDQKTSAQIGLWQQMAAEMGANPTAFAYAPVDQNGNFDATGRGPLGIVPAGTVQPGATGVMVPGADGKAVLAMVMPHSVYTTDPTNPNASPQLAGYQISYNVGGKTIEMWGYKDNHNANHWSLVSPLASGSTTAVDKKGDVYVTPAAIAGLPEQIAGLRDSAGNPLQLTAEQQASLAAGGSITAITDTTKKGQAGVKQTITVSVTNGYLTSTTKTDQIDAKGAITASTTMPAQLTQGGGAFSASRLSAGDLPGITFDSAMQASVKAASYTQTQDQVSKFASDPAFQQAFLSQTMQVLGTHDPYDPRIAAAWKDITTASHIGATSAEMKSMSAAQRTDLRFPGVGDGVNKDAYNKQLQINFGGQQLTVPGLPSYLQNQQATIGGGGSAAGWATASPWANLLPGLGLPQMPQGSPTPTVTPAGVTPTATPPPAGVGPIPTATPAPTSMPPPHPVSPGSGYGPGK